MLTVWVGHLKAGQNTRKMRMKEAKWLNPWAKWVVQYRPQMEPDTVDTSVIIRILTHARSPVLREELGAEMTAWSAAQQQSAILILDCSH